MYDGAETVLARIVTLAEACPEPYRSTAFQILLKGYVDSLCPLPRADKANPKTERHGSSGLTTVPALDSSVPADVQTRLKSMAKRRNVPAEALAGLFDFSVDPFTFAPLNVNGDGASDRSRKVALLVAARAFLATGTWRGDWAEIKAMCVHQSCYDVANFAKVLKKAKGEIFKTVEPGKAVELSSTGTEQAEQLLAAMCGPDNAAKQ